MSPHLAYRLKKVVTIQNPVSKYLRKNWVGAFSTAPFSGKLELEREAEWIQNEIRGWP